MITFLLLLALISIPTLAANTDCQIATPRYGSVVCKDQGIYEAINKNFIKSNKEITTALSCLSDCELKISDIKDPQGKSITSSSNFCSGTFDELWFYVTKNGITETSKEGTLSGINGPLSILFTRKDSVSIRMFCKFFSGQTDNIDEGSSVSYRQKKIMLEEAWAGSLEYVPIPSTEGCTLNDVVDKYAGDKRVSSWLDPNTGEQKSTLPSTYSSTNEMPTNWEVSQSYVYVKDWQTGIASISLAYDKQNNAYWCGGLSNSRKIYSVNEVVSNSGTCYAVPTSISKSVECCFPSDCTWKGSKYTCNPDTWSCEETRWCDSELDCQQVFGEGICQNNQITQWSCNTNKPWGNHKGTCERSVRSVQQCPSDCTTSEYYNEESGTCKSRITVLDCPSGKCCKSGGDYKEKTCSTGLECCSVGNSLIGECKQSCEPPPQTEDKQQTSSEKGNILTGQEIANTGPIDLMVILVPIIIIAVGGVGAYFLFWNKNTNILKSTRNSRDKFCTKCGTQIRLESKFCTKCRKKVRE